MRRASGSPPVAHPNHSGTLALRGGDGAEECINVYRTSTLIRGYRNPRVQGTPIRTVESGRRVAANDRDLAITVIPEAVQARVVAPITVPVSVYGRTRYVTSENEPATGSLRLATGQPVELLSLECPEGDCTAYFRYDGTVYSTYVGAGSEEQVTAAMSRVFRPDAFPRSELWLRLTARQGRAAAWVRLDDSNSESIDCDYVQW